jgi:hypothetical protein
MGLTLEPKKTEVAFDFPFNKLFISYFWYFVFLLLPDFSILFSTKNATTVLSLISTPGA